MVNDLAIFEKSLSIGSLGAYTHWVNQLPMLSAEEEQELAMRLKNNNDLEAARKLILSHLRLVTKIARGFNGYGLQQADLIQEGNIGLMKAVRRFDPTVGVRLMSYAIHWIRAEIHEFVIRNWRIVKIATTKAQRKLFFNLRKLTKSNRLTEADVKMVADELNVSDKDVRVMAQRMANFDQSFETTACDDENGESWNAPSQYLEDQNSNPEHYLEQQNSQETRYQALSESLALLDERAKDILQRRWLVEEKATLHELAKEYHISAERVRQIEKNTMLQIRNKINLS